MPTQKQHKSDVCNLKEKSQAPGVLAYVQEAAVTQPSVHNHFINTLVVVLNGKYKYLIY